MQTIQMTITPEIAKSWLEKNTINRSVKENHVDFLVSEIKKGAWKVTHQGVAFSVNDVLLDGQHRLLAIVKSNMAINMLVTFGLQDDAMGIIDGAAIVRNVSDRLKLSGNDSWVYLQTSVAVFNCITVAANSKKLSVSDIESVAKTMTDECIVILKKYSTATKIKSITTAPIYASILLFVYHNPNKLDVALRFLSILTTGEYDSSKKGELTVIKLRQHLISYGTKYQLGSKSRLESMAVCQYAIMKFASGSDICKMKISEHEIYPRIKL
jgi:hypothetical protein